jgi:AraC-like DNA-binding protein
VVFQSSDLRDCLQLLERFTPLRLTVIRTTLVEDAHHLGLEVELKESTGDAHIPVIETLLLSLTGLISAVSQGTVKPQLVELDYPRPAHAEQYKDAFGASSYRFSRPNLRVLIASRDASLPTGTDTDPELRVAAIKRCEELLRGVLGHQSTSDTIRQIFADNPGHLWTLSDIAGHLNMSDRTLQRRLGAEGTGYKQLHNEWLKSEAQHLLQEDNLSIESIALLLGYSDVSNFRHACRRWYKLSPNDYRKSLRARR